MRILWVSNAPWVSTGYGVQTRLFVPRLIAAGHDVSVCALYGLEGGPIVWNGIKCLPRGRDALALDVIGPHAEACEADVTITLVDAWAIDPQRFAEHGVRWVPWFPVDMEPMPPPVAAKVRKAFATMVFSRFGERMARAAEFDPLYVPHGVDTAAMRPMAQDEARRFLGLPRDRWLVGMVAANKDCPSRKAFPQVFEAFARFRQRHSDAMLYLHTTRGDEPWWRDGGTDLNALIRHFGLEKHVVGANAYNLLLGYPDEAMAHVYSALDALVSPSLGEGFGVPIVEAQACGCPVLVGDWTSMSELCFAGYRIPQERSEAFWTPLQSFQRLPHVSAIEDGLDWLFAHRGDQQLRTRARAGALAYDVERVVDDWWRPALAQLAQRLEKKKFPSNQKAVVLCGALAVAPPGPAVQIGSLQSAREVPMAGFDGLHLARACEEAGREFRSFDSDPQVVETANRALAREGVAHRVRCQEGVEALREQPAIAFLHLAFSKDPADALAKLATARLVPGAIVFVDEAQPIGQLPHGKASLLVPLLASQQCEYQFVPTDPGCLALIVRMLKPKTLASAEELAVAGSVPT